MTDKLLPCPFCGGSDVHLRHHQPAQMSWVSCVSCGLEAPTETGVTDDEAVTYWNRRPPAPKLTNDDALLKAALAVEQWWLERGMFHFDGAPYAIFALRAALSTRKGSSEGDGSATSAKGVSE